MTPKELTVSVIFDAGTVERSVNTLGTWLRISPGEGVDDSDDIPDPVREISEPSYSATDHRVVPVSTGGRYW